MADEPTTEELVEQTRARRKAHVASVTKKRQQAATEHRTPEPKTTKTKG